MDSQILNDIVSAFVQALQAGTATLTSYSFPLLLMAATLAFYFQVGPQLAQGGIGVADTLGSFLLLLLKIGIVYWIVLSLPDLANAAFDTFVQWGAAASGGSFTRASFFSPGEVVDMGFRVGRPLRDFFTSVGAWLGGNTNWATLLVYFLAYWITVAGFFFLALALMMTIIEFNLAVMAGTVLIPWAVFPALAFLAETSIGLIVGSLVRVLFTAALVGLARPLFRSLTPHLSSGQDPTWYSAVLCGGVSLIFTILAWVIPARAAALAGRVSLALGAGDVIAGVATTTRLVSLPFRAAIRGASRLITRGA